ncbi:MAG: hypothetical protein K2O54_02115, partial [Prevotella sp.]|nr:hypothetical protein [Prevotella sp.]
MADIDYEKTHVLGRGGAMNDAIANVDIERTLPNTTLDTSPLMVDLPISALERTLKPEGVPDQMNAVSNTKQRIFNLKGDEYIEKACLSDNSGEGQVFLVEHDGK